MAMAAFGPVMSKPQSFEQAFKIAEGDYTTTTTLREALQEFGGFYHVEKPRLGAF
ncbi:MAG: hypothetical protein ABI395_07220 [Sphingobium sp.]